VSSTALRKSGASPAEIAHLAHGTTLVINALTERKGVVTGLITSEGFRDVLEIARGPPTGRRARRIRHAGGGEARLRRRRVSTPPGRRPDRAIAFRRVFRH
jgi:N-methylhydantoinase A/oxoprolinase/acetone carboxylase beta subunit